MSNNLKRFFYYWRLPLLFFVLFFVLLWLASVTEGDTSGLISALWLFVDVPALLFFTVRSIFIRIRSAITYHRTGIHDEAFIFPEINFVQGFIDSIADTFDSVRLLSPGMKLRFFIFRVVGILLIIGGTVGCFFFAESTLLIVLFTLVIIAGATLCITADPKSYNSHVDGVRIVACPGDLSTEELYPYLCKIPTALGAPRFAAIRNFKKPVMVYGSSEDEYIFTVYRATLSEFFYVSMISSFSLKENLPATDAQRSSGSYSAVVRGVDNYLGEITVAVEEAIALARN